MPGMSGFFGCERKPVARISRREVIGVLPRSCTVQVPLAAS
jgi:hypothetical protein